VRTGLKNVKISPLTGFLDLRSPPDLIPVGGWRWAQNFEVLEKDTLCATTGHRRLLDKPSYNNADLHDQLFGNPRETFQMLFPAETPQGYSQLFAGSHSRLYALNTESENWRIISDTFGGGTFEGCSDQVWNAAANGNVVAFTNGADAPVYHIVDQPSIEDGQQAVSLIPDLVALNVTKVGRVWTWNNVTFYANIEIDGQRSANQILWSDYKRPLSIIPSSSSLAGRKFLDDGEVVLNGKELGNQFLIYTNKGIWVMSAVGLPNIFDFTKRYPAERPGDRTLAYPNTLLSIGSKHFYMGVDGVYQYDFYLPEPSRVEWIHLASGRVYDTIDSSRCNVHVGGYNLRKKAIWFSWVKKGESCPSETFLINTEYPWTSYLDCGFSAFANWNARTAMSLRRFMLDRCICSEQEMEQSGIGLIKEGGSCFPQPSVNCTILPPSLFFKNTTTGGYVSLTVIGEGEARQFVFGAEVSSAPSKFYEVLNLIDPDTGDTVPLSIVGPAGLEQFNFGDHVSSGADDVLFFVVPNQTTGRVVQVTMTGAVLAEQLIFGVETAIMGGPQSFWTQQELVDGDIITEDWTKTTPDPNSLCALLGGITPSDLCDAEFLGGECNAAELFVMASTADGCLKESADIYYRELCVGFQGCGQYERRGYRPLLRSGADSLGAPEVLKNVQMLEVEAHPPEQTVPARIKLRLGSSVQAQDPNVASGRCVIMWEEFDPIELRCLSEHTAEEHRLAGTYPDDSPMWPVEQTAYYFYFELEIFNDVVMPADTGCAVCLSRVSFYTGTPRR
jgi:hypothetical protein